MTTPDGTAEKVINTFTQRPVVLQIVAYAVTLLYVILFYATVQNNLKSQIARIIFLAIITPLVFGKALFWLLTSLSNPTD